MEGADGGLFLSEGVIVSGIWTACSSLLRSPPTAIAKVEVCCMCVCV